MSAVRQTAAIKRWVMAPLSPEVNKALYRLALAEDVVQLAVVVPENRIWVSYSPDGS